MDRVDIVRDIVSTKELAVIEQDNILVSKSNKKLNNIIKYSVKKAQEVIGEENIYKEYLIENKDSIIKTNTINTDVDTIEEAMVIINQVDFRYIFGFDVALEEIFQCKFVNRERRISCAFETLEESNGWVENERRKYSEKEISILSYERFGMYVIEMVIKGGDTEAWISYSKNRNKYLYIVGDKSKDRYSVTITFDVLDLYQIFTNNDIKKAIEELSELLGIRIKEIEAIKDKYEKCRDFLRSNLNKDRFLILCELIGEHMSKLETVLNEGLEKLYYHEKSNNNWVFSSSMEYLSVKMYKSKSAVNPVINTFSLLGFIEKPDVNSGKYTKWNRNDITYFSIPEYNEELFLKAEEIAKVMLYNGKRVTASSFSYSTCKEKFGEGIANSIFKDKVTKAKAS
ncbi:hypothetical protein OSC52_13515 [Clostridium pasteurianum]|uniref:hypothetical protein n=1 Tax=Clostridium pasteurianum TaxID=1501 RepID=UPI002260CA18|nr:hypothetical protein [Clostridium pasteurianum]UZW12867.1 hypothetical protein OSC52_13515 [Clostridium pasteurianum]